MMSIFKDKVYDDMDWLEKACVPIVCELNDVLNNLPDTITLTYQQVVQFGCNYGPSSIEVDNIIGTMIDRKLDHPDKKRIYDCFDIVVEGEPILNLEDESLINGCVKVIKIKEAFEEKEIEGLIGRRGIDEFLRNIDHRDVETERANEILELLGLAEARRSRSGRQKIDAIKAEIENIMAENKWDIRDMGLSNRVSLWLNKYLKAGNIAAYMNFCKLKVMTHNEKPIYSVEGEEQV
jgi:hypothetical protein